MVPGDKPSRIMGAGSRQRLFSWQLTEQILPPRSPFSNKGFSFEQAPDRDRPEPKDCVTHSVPQPWTLGWRQHICKAASPGQEQAAPPPVHMAKP